MEGRVELRDSEELDREQIREDEVPQLKRQASVGGRLVDG
jgi:hypothetical protein